MAETAESMILAAETASQPAATAENFNEQLEYPKLDGVLFPLVAANANVVASCAWLGGLEVSLTDALLSYPVQMTEDNADQVIADVYAFLAKAQEKLESPEEDTDAEEENQVDEAETSEELQPQDGAIEKKKPVAKIEEKIPNDTKASEIERPEAKPIKNPKIKPETDIKLAKPLSNLKPEPAKPIVETSQAIAKPEPRPQPAVEERFVELVEEPEPAIEIQSDKEDETDVVEAMEIEPETTTKPVLEIQQVELENPPVADGISESHIEAEANIEKVESEALTESLASEEEEIDEITQPTPNPLIELIEEESVALQIAEEAIEIDVEVEDSELVMAAEPDSLETAEQTLSPELELSASLEEVEEAIDQLATALESADSEQTEAAVEILDKIVEVAGQTNDDNQESNLSDAESQEKIERLFIELFDCLGLNYTQEVVESLAKLTRHGFLNEDIKSLKTESADKLAHDVGTHEIIVKIKAGLSLLKKAMANAWAIGKSTLQLCNLKFASHVQLRLLEPNLGKA